MVERLETKTGQFEKATFIVNTRTSHIAGGGDVRLKDREIGVLHWDDKLTLEFSNARPTLRALEITPANDVITVYLAGDSTVTDQTAEPWAAWGQMLPRFFGPGLAIANHAESGETLKAFVSENRLAKVKSQMKPGDYLFIQFTHNDQKPGANYLEPFTTYKEHVKRFISEARERGVTPVLVTSMLRRNFGADGKIVNTLGDYPEALRQVASEEHVALIDLFVASKAFYEALGPEASKKAFVHYPAGTFPGQDQELKDDTHFNSYGAYELARAIVDGIKKDVPALAKHLVAGLPSFDPSHPDPVSDWKVPASPPRVAPIPASAPGPVPSATPNAMAIGGNAKDFDMAPETRLEVVQAAVDGLPTKLPPGPFAPTWASLKEHYRVPQWFEDARFGLFIHWGLYAVPAHHNEWYEKHMYGNPAIAEWHVQTFGPPEAFGYKDFIPLFTAEKFDASAWADLFRDSGARYVIPTAQHHDNFALWDSAVTPFNAMKMGPRRDLIGELARAVRARGLKFGVSNHGIENFQFVNPPADLAARLKEKRADLFDPEWAGFYNVADRSDEACRRFLVDWFMRNVELIEKYEPDMLWFDNGVDMRYLDPLKLQIAAYYYNRAQGWGKDVSLSTKKAAYAPSDNNAETIGSIIDFEKIGARSPSGIRPGAWQVDEPIGSTWGYTTGMQIASSSSIISKLADTVSKNGTLLLNLSPMKDGTIPVEQQETLRAVGRWLKVNGEAIYGTHNWIAFGEGGAPGDTGVHVRFTVKGDALFAIVLDAAPGEDVLIPSLGTARALDGAITSVRRLGVNGSLTFTRVREGLRVTLPSSKPAESAYVLEIRGLRMTPKMAIRSGNPK